MTFDEVYRTHRSGITRYLSRCCDHLVEIDDAVQETFLQAWRVWTRRTSDNIRAWLIGIARRVFSHMRRAAFARTESRQIEWTQEADHRQQPANQELVVYVEQLRAKFAGLGPAQAVVMNGLADGYTAQEIAHQRGASEASTRMAVSVARKRLREKLDVTNFST